MNFKKVLFFLILISFNLLNANTQIYYGKIGNQYPITMELTFNDDHNISGYYLYNKWKKKIKLTGKYNNNNFSLNTNNEIFTGVFSNKKISGKWNSASSNMDFFGYSEKNIDPFEDKKLTCREMKAYPEIIFDSSYGIDLGSGHGSPLDVEYNCKNSIASLKFMKNLLLLAENVRSEGSSGHCTGSIIHAQWRYYHFTLLKLGLAPNSISSSSASYLKNQEDSVKKYFSSWAYANLENFKLYTSFWKKYNEKYPLLVEHYKQAFFMSQEQAVLYTENVLREILMRAAGSSGTYYEKDDVVFSKLESLLMESTSTLEDLKKELQNKYISYYLSRALKTALLHHKPKTFLRVLLDDGAKVNEGQESALFFEESNLDKIQFLLDNGADINYQNLLGKTALYYAIERNNIDLIKLLIKNGAEINHQYIDAKTKEDYLELCSLQHTKRTPLMHAAQHSNLEILKILILEGANKNAIDEIGYNILDYAHMGKKDENIVYLESIGLTTKRTYW